MRSILEQLTSREILPLVTLENAADAVPIAEALKGGGVPIAEVTFRTAAAVESIKQIATHVPDVLVGAGTVHTIEQAKQAISVGAKFIITPATNPKLIDWCVRNNIPIVPGIASPSDIEVALKYGLDLCKFFPAEAYGGISTLQALLGPYPTIKFIPTGGIKDTNMLNYLNLPNVSAIGGSFICPKNLVQEKNWNDLQKLVSSLLYKTFDFRLAHVGINKKKETGALEIAKQFASLLNLPVAEMPGSYFTGNLIEVIKDKPIGDMGHIAISTRNIYRAKEYLSSKGIEFDESTASFSPKGCLTTVYLKNYYGGFAIHLLQKNI